jgi:hypothetical protein
MKPKTLNPKNEVVLVRIDRKTRIDLEAIARQNKIKLATIVRQAIINYIEEYDKNKNS